VRESAPKSDFKTSNQEYELMPLAMAEKPSNIASIGDIMLSFASYCLKLTTNLFIAAMPT
jgi:hypothetical protein